ncbi:metallophosphoesterase [Bartonella machadoae]|uniref:metallophosphoesterase n=1 Tax=Bartonella machadoae TaxID=2893471 RepID=UPI001F4CA0A1|nr:metallophosphoesterase [Bartonella machadoae]UNE53815.1 metallophosphoesterase [Bartonella machadoae]
MKYKYRTIIGIFLAICPCIKPSFLHAQALSVTHEKRQNVIEKLPKRKQSTFDDHSTTVSIAHEHTNPPSSMVLTAKTVERGQWKAGEDRGKREPSKIIASGSIGKAATLSHAWLFGASGRLKYKAQDDKTLLPFRRDNPSMDALKYSVSSSNKNYYLERREERGKNAKVIWYVKKTAPIKDYSVIIAADPQPWRLKSGDANAKSNREPWLQTNKKVANAIESHAATFHIINGDLTEFGRPQTYQDYADVYKSSLYPVYEGLGNHDYYNNVGNCTLPIANLSKDACAISAVKRMIQEIDKYSLSLPQFNKHVMSRQLIHLDTAYDIIMGSLSYSWDYGDIHYVQLQNYPTYTVNLSDGHTNIIITKALDWLKKDLAAADQRGKVTILNFHDARPYYREKHSHFLQPKNAKNLAAFKEIITSHNVKAIFVGHNHHPSYCRAQDDKVFGNIPVYTAGALFRGDYYLVDVQGKDLHVKAYNGRTGKAILVRDLKTSGITKRFRRSCSNL